MAMVASEIRRFWTVYDTEGIWRGDIEVELNLRPFKLFVLWFLTTFDMIREEQHKNYLSGEVSRSAGMVVCVKYESGTFGKKALLLYDRMPSRKNGNTTQTRSFLSSHHSSGLGVCIGLDVIQKNKSDGIPAPPAINTALLYSLKSMRKLTREWILVNGASEMRTGSTPGSSTCSSPPTTQITECPSSWRWCRLLLSQTANKWSVKTGLKTDIGQHNNVRKLEAYLSHRHDLLNDQI